MIVSCVIWWSIFGTGEQLDMLVAAAISTTVMTIIRMLFAEVIATGQQQSKSRSAPQVLRIVLEVTILLLLLGTCYVHAPLLVA